MLVRGVEEGSPAAAAGIAEGDLLVAAAGKAIDDVDAIHEILRDAGFPLEVTLVRGTEERTVTVTAPAVPTSRPTRAPPRTSPSTDSSPRRPGRVHPAGASSCRLGVRSRLGLHRPEPCVVAGELVEVREGDPAGDDRVVAGDVGGRVAVAVLQLHVQAERNSRA